MHKSMILINKGRLFYDETSELAEPVGSIPCIVSWMPIYQGEPLGRTLAGWNRPWPWEWFAGERLLRQMPQRWVGGALWEGKPPFGHWSKAEKGFHINCLEMLEVCRAYQFFLPDLRGHKVLIHSDNMYVMWNRQGGLSSKRLFILVERLLEWAQLNLRSLRAAHILSNWTGERTCYLRALSPQKSGCSIPRRFRGFGWSLVQI